MTVFTNHGRAASSASRSPRPTPARSCRWICAPLGGELICQKDSFLCAARGVSMGIAFQKKIGVGLFGGEGFIMQRLQGDGLCFVHAGGTVHALELAAGRDAARRHGLPRGAAAGGAATTSSSSAR